jgi:kynureninase
LRSFSSFTSFPAGILIFFLFLQYAFASHVKLNDYSPDSLLPVHPRPNEHSIRTEDILKIIEEEGESIAVICFGAVQYYNGEWFDMEAITKAGQAKVSTRFPFS